MFIFSGNKWRFFPSLLSSILQENNHPGQGTLVHLIQQWVIVHILLFRMQKRIRQRTNCFRRYRWTYKHQRSICRMWGDHCTGKAAQGLPGCNLWWRFSWIYRSTLTLSSWKLWNWRHHSPSRACLLLCRMLRLRSRRDLTKEVKGREQARGLLTNLQWDVSSVGGTDWECPKNHPEARVQTPPHQNHQTSYHDYTIKPSEGGS